MKKQFILFAIILLPLLASCSKSRGGKCTGEQDCSSCTDCSKCEHCNEDGGMCGVCGDGEDTYYEP